MVTSPVKEIVFKLKKDDISIHVVKCEEHGGSGQSNKEQAVLESSTSFESDFSSVRDPKKRTNLELSGRDTFELEKKKRTKSITSEENIDIDRTNTVVVRKNIFHSPYAEHSSDCSTPRELYDKLRKNNNDNAH